VCRCAPKKNVMTNEIARFGGLIFFKIIILSELIGKMCSTV
jgi:hypothetical protein